MKSQNPHAVTTPLYGLALGTFAIGTEGFMIAGLLPDMAADLSVSIAAAGQLVTAFALAYAFSSPVLTALTGSLDRRRLLVASLAAFALANLVAWQADSYASLMAARILLALAAGLYVPNANALAAAIVPPDRRGTALGIVNGGTTIAIALGVPLGAYLGHWLGWRATFAAVTALSAVAAVMLVVALPHQAGGGLVVASLRQRLAVARHPGLFDALLMTTLWATGSYTVYTYLAAWLQGVVGGSEAVVGVSLFLWGTAAAVGVLMGGRLNDSIGPRAVILPSLVLAAVGQASLSLIAWGVAPAHALLPVLLALALWGAASWAVHPAQMARLIGIAGASAAPVALSLNASFLYLGFALGASLGSFTLTVGTLADLGWVGGLCQLAAALWLFRRRIAKPAL